MARSTVQPTGPEPGSARAWWIVGAALGGGSLAWAALGWLGLGADAGAGVAPGLDALASVLAWSRPAPAEAWRWWTAAWVHLSPLHLGANLAGLLGVLLLGASARLPAAAALAWWLAWPLTHLLLFALAPGLAGYAGLSGVLHAGVACAGLWLVLRPGRVPGSAGARRRMGLLVLLVLGIKVLLEAPWTGGAARGVVGWDIPVVPMAHAAGVLAAGLTSAALLGGAALRRALTRRRRTASVRAESPDE